jgi:hypothetical protein
MFNVGCSMFDVHLLLGGFAVNLFFTAIPQEGLAWSGKTGWC